MLPNHCFWWKWGIKIPYFRHGANWLPHSCGICRVPQQILPDTGYLLHNYIFHTTTGIPFVPILKVRGAWGLRERPEGPMPCAAGALTAAQQHPPQNNVCHTTSATPQHLPHNIPVCFEFAGPKGLADARYCPGMFMKGPGKQFASQHLLYNMYKRLPLSGSKSQT